MKRIKLYLVVGFPVLMLCLLLAIMNVSAQDEIKFNQTPTWADAKAKAAQEGKLIFLDCYTSWCSPCRWMEKNVFTVAAVSDFYNRNFINVKIDMEKGEGIELRKIYGVQLFPTYLFINSSGEVVHRTDSRMSAEEFLEEGKKATDPKRNLAYLNKKYQDGVRDLPFLLDYQIALSKSDRTAADKIAKDIINVISNEQLNTELGWKVIKTLARNENDKLGAYFIANEQVFGQWSTPAEGEVLRDRLATSTMYGYLYAHDEANFFRKLTYFKNSDKPNRKIQGIMLEATYYLNAGQPDKYIAITNQALKTELKDDAEKLGFLARSVSYTKIEDISMKPRFLQQAYLMAKRAVELQPGDYGMQSTFASVCLVMKRKDEALVAAKKARVFADAETSKIQKIAQELLDKVEVL